METQGFVLSSLDSLDESQLEISVPLPDGTTTSWLWTFAGPGHPKGIAQTDRVFLMNSKRRAREQQQVLNGRKVKVDAEDFEETHESNVSFVVDRLLGWNDTLENGQPVLGGDGAPYSFTEANARKLLADRRKPKLLQQCIEFILDDASFMPRSAKN